MRPAWGGDLSPPLSNQRRRLLETPGTSFLPHHSMHTVSCTSYRTRRAVHIIPRTSFRAHRSAHIVTAFLLPVSDTGFRYPFPIPVSDTRFRYPFPIPLGRPFEIAARINPRPTQGATHRRFLSIHDGCPMVRRGRCVRHVRRGPCGRRGRRVGVHGVSNNRRCAFGLGGADKSAPYDLRPTILLQRDGVELIVSRGSQPSARMTTLYVPGVA